MAVPAAVPRSAARRELLLVAQLSPPSNLSAARRVAGLVKYLDRLGHQVTVLTSMSSGAGPLPGAAHVVRTRDLLVSPLNWRRQSFASLAGGGDAGYEAAPSRVASLLVPDLAVVGWLPFALPRALGLASARRFDAVLTTSPPHSGHLIGLALHRRGLPWVADFRDGWTFESNRPAWPLAAQRALDGRLERAVATSAGRVVAVSHPIAADLRRRFEREVATITNGFDPDEHGGGAPAAAALGPPAPSPDRHTLLHAGRMAYAGRSPAPLLDALERAPDLRRRLEVLFAGPLSEQERVLIERPGLEGAARAVGSLDRGRTLALESASDSLLVLTTGHRRGEATQKVFEYLAAGKPVLVLGEDTEAARIVGEAAAGIVAPADDPDAIVTALWRLVDGGAPAAAAGAVERYSYARLAEAMAEEVERVICAAG